jgi:hypothetical protein
MSPKVLVRRGGPRGGLVLPDVSAAQAPPGQDSVTFTGGPALAGSLTVTSINATSGPSGENPSGEVNGAPVTCLAVRGNTATINTRIPLPRPPPFDFGIVTVQVIDDQPDTFDVPEVGRAPTDCSPAGPGVVGGPLSAGDITVVDAPPLPTSKDQCKNGGWKTFAFKAQGRCIAFNQPERKPQP